MTFLNVLQNEVLSGANSLWFVTDVSSHKNVVFDYKLDKSYTFERSKGWHPDKTEGFVKDVKRSKVSICSLPIRNLIDVFL